MSLFVNKNNPMGKSMELLDNKELTYEEAGIFFDFISPEYKVIKKSNYLIIKVPNIKKEICEEKYLIAFNELAKKRFEQLSSETNLQKKRKKIADYLLYRGWESFLVYDKIRALV